MHFCCALQPIKDLSRIISSSVKASWALPVDSAPFDSCHWASPLLQLPLHCHVVCLFTCWSPQRQPLSLFIFLFPGPGRVPGTQHVSSKCLWSSLCLPSNAIFIAEGPKVQKVSLTSRVRERHNRIMKEGGIGRGACVGRRDWITLGVEILF